MSYHSKGLMDDMVNVPAITGVAGGYITNTRKSVLTNIGEMDNRGNGGNTKVDDMKLLRAYCANRGNSKGMNTFLPPGERFNYENNINPRFRKWIKRFHIWIAHAWLRGKPLNIYNPKSGTVSKNPLFFKNENLLVEWITHLHNHPTGDCKFCHGSGLEIKEKGYFQWNYCWCKRGELRKNCWKSRPKWDEAKAVFLGQ